MAKNLYTSKARFVFELLQNADDNSYTRAAAADVAPYVKFRVFPQQIVIECNEDGFTEENLSAICSVGKSSKTGAQGYIGEKGIGFKSVFMVAWRVHIRSGAFSFSFTHRSGNSGMGMISPVWEGTDGGEDAGEGLERPQTRITLHLHEASGADADSLASTRRAIRAQFEDLQETILLFMRNLREIHVAFYDEAGEQTSSAAYSMNRPQPSRALLKRIKVAADGTTEERVSHFHVTVHNAKGLAKNENRAYSDIEEAARTYSKSQVVLAFPLSEDTVPIVEPQDLFVFLPVRPVGFSFIIHADFVTSANRQDIVADSPRNRSLLDAIADAFVKAAVQLCEHATLRYQWPRYLPDKQSQNRDTLWASLVLKIADRLSRAHVLYGRTRPEKRRIGDLLILTPNVLDEDGHPLFDDGDPEQIMSQHYSQDDLGHLRPYGLRDADLNHILQWLQKDLQLGPQSRMKAIHTPDSWHTRVAKLLHLPFDNIRWNQQGKNLKAMNLLPLEDGTWVPASSGSVYFAQVDGTDIPSDVCLRLISRKVANPDRKRLFKLLGVKTAPVALVRKKILQRYSPDQAPSSVSVSKEESVRHLQFLYTTQPSSGNDEPPYSRLAVYCQGVSGDMYQPYMTCVYAPTLEPSLEPYGPSELFRETAPGPHPGDGAPGFPCKFLDDIYYTDAPTKPQDEMSTFREWLISDVGVAKYVALWHDPILQREGRYLQEHRPEKFLGALRVWHEYPGEFSQASVDRLKTMEVLCRGNRRVPLERAYFPNASLEFWVGRYVEQGVFFPWLWLGTEDTQESALPRLEGLLSKLGVIRSPLADLDFALDMLAYSLDAFPQTHRATSISVRRLFSLYGHIKGRQMLDLDAATALERIRYAYSVPWQTTSP